MTLPKFAPVAAILGLGLALLDLAACQAIPVPVLVPASTQSQIPSTACDACGQATQVGALTQASINTSAQQAQATATADIQIAEALATGNAGTATEGAALAQDEIGAIALQAQAAATADIMRAHALATYNAANSTQSAARTQDSLNASALQAQVAATAEVVRANALATVNAASATQSSALTQAALQETQVQLHLRLVAQSETQQVAAAGTQQWMGAQVAGTATTLAQAMIDETQSAAAIAQQNDEQNRAPLVFVWKWGLPIFLAAAAILALWGFRRWLKLKTPRPRAAAPVAARPIILRERVRSLARQLPTLARRKARLAETKPKPWTVDRPAKAEVPTDSSMAAAPPPANGPPLRTALEIVQPLVPGISRVEAEAPPAEARV